MNPVNKENIVTALQSASLALSASHRLTVTDQATLPREQWQVYMLDHVVELAQIDAALVSLGEPTNIDNVRECCGCNSCPSMPSGLFYFFGLKGESS